MGTSRPFTFSEFQTKTAVLKNRAAVLSYNMGYSASPTNKTTNISVSWHSLLGMKEKYAGSPVMNAEFQAITSDLTLSIVNGDLLTVDGITYEIVFFEKVESFVGNQLSIYVKTYRE